VILSIINQCFHKYNQVQSSVFSVVCAILSFCPIFRYFVAFGPIFCAILCHFEPFYGHFLAILCHLHTLACQVPGVMHKCRRVNNRRKVAQETVGFIIKFHIKKYRFFKKKIYLKKVLGIVRNNFFKN
jgi:hypothetical protein